MGRIIIGLVLACCGSLTFAEKIGEINDVAEPHPIAVTESKLCVVDANHTIHVYSLEPFEHTLSFGRKGDGPHDFKYPVRIYPQDEALVALDFTKSLWFDRTGTAVKVVDYTSMTGFDPNQECRLVPVGNGSYLRATVDHDQARERIHLLDSDLQVVKLLHEGSFDWGRPGDGFNPMPHRIHTVCRDDRVYIADSEKGFWIRIFDETGKVVRTIDRTADEEKIPFTADHREQLVTEIRTTQPDWIARQLENARFPEHYPMIHQLFVSGDHIYVTTYRTQEQKHEIVVLDHQGKLVKRTFLPLPAMKRYRRIMRYDLLDIADGAVYELVRNPEKSEQWLVYRTVIE
jgi:hypothetical protein